MKRQESIDLFFSWLTISLAFSWLFSGLSFQGVLASFPIVGIAVGSGFVLHELAHRFVAKKFKAHAYYKAWPFGLVFVLITAIFGFIFAAPGAVYIYGDHIDRKKNGIISLAGPLTNIVLAFVFLLFFLASQNGSFLWLVGTLGFQINLWLALFNLIPIPPLDGSKVFLWQPLIWAIVFIPVAVLVFLPWVLF
ncbi:MAG: site-2 protease family protein [Candidatus Diapherotrites archaeon]|uniref:Site-2 protease family protein n=1 Tax=Candidatus Iainarchaeum sp. TaxID=3101447 RepID=A0A8T4KX19_9ARCH|nr:site-2 protease family protein [Candidatus Diapherotrites archaeon]